MTGRTLILPILSKRLASAPKLAIPCSLQVNMHAAEKERERERGRRRTERGGRWGPTRAERGDRRDKSKQGAAPDLRRRGPVLQVLQGSKEENPGQPQERRRERERERERESERKKPPKPTAPTPQDPQTKPRNYQDTPERNTANTNRESYPTNPLETNPKQKRNSKTIGKDKPNTIPTPETKKKKQTEYPTSIPEKPNKNQIQNQQSLGGLVTAWWGGPWAALHSWGVTPGDRSTEGYKYPPHYGNRPRWRKSGQPTRHKTITPKDMSWRLASPLDTYTNPTPTDEVGITFGQTKPNKKAHGT